MVRNRRNEAGRTDRVGADGSPGQKPCPGMGGKGDPYSLSQSDEEEGYRLQAFQKYRLQKRKQTVMKEDGREHRLQKRKQPQDEEEVMNQKLRDAGFPPEDMTDQEKLDLVKVLQISCETHEHDQKLRRRSSDTSENIPEEISHVPQPSSSQTGSQRSKDVSQPKCISRRSVDHDTGPTPKVRGGKKTAKISSNKKEGLEIDSSSEDESEGKQRPRAREIVKVHKSSASKDLPASLPGVAGKKATKKQMSLYNVKGRTRSGKKAKMKSVQLCADIWESASSESDPEQIADTSHTAMSQCSKVLTKLKGHDTQQWSQVRETVDTDNEEEVKQDEDAVDVKALKSDKPHYIKVDLDESEDTEDPEGAADDAAQDVSLVDQVSHSAMLPEEVDGDIPNSCDPDSGISASQDLFEILDSPQKSQSPKSQPEKDNVDLEPGEDLMSTPGRAADSDNESPLPSSGSRLKQLEDKLPGCSMQTFDMFEKTCYHKCDKCSPSKRATPKKQCQSSQEDDKTERCSQKIDTGRRASTPTSPTRCRLINKRKLKLEIADNDPFYAPPGISPDDYTDCIVGYFHEYRMILRARQARVMSHVLWGKPVVVGRHVCDTIDYKIRGQVRMAHKDFQLVPSSDDDDDVSTKNPKISAQCRTLRQTRLVSHATSWQHFFNNSESEDDDFILIRKENEQKKVKGKNKKDSLVSKKRKVDEHMIQQTSTDDARTISSDVAQHGNVQVGNEEGAINLCANQANPTTPLTSKSRISLPTKAGISPYESETAGSRRIQSNSRMKSKRDSEKKLPKRKLPSSDEEGEDSFYDMIPRKFSKARNKGRVFENLSSEDDIDGDPSTEGLICDVEDKENQGQKDVGTKTQSKIITRSKRVKSQRGKGVQKKDSKRKVEVLETSGGSDQHEVADNEHKVYDTERKSSLASSSTRAAGLKADMKHQEITKNTNVGNPNPEKIDPLLKLKARVVAETREYEDDMLCRDSPLYRRLTRVLLAKPEGSGNEAVDEAEEVKQPSSPQRREVSLKPAEMASSTDDECEEVDRVESPAVPKVECPICLCQFPAATIEHHAANCDAPPPRPPLQVQRGKPPAPQVAVSSPQQVPQSSQSIRIKEDTMNRSQNSGVNGEPLQDESANDADSTDEECPKRVTKARHSKRTLAVTTKETRGKRQKTEPVKVVAEEKLGHCPLCNQTFQLSKLEAHVDTCLDQQEAREAEPEEEIEPYHLRGRRL